MSDLSHTLWYNTAVQRQNPLSQMRPQNTKDQDRLHDENVRETSSCAPLSVAKIHRGTVPTPN